MANLLNINVRRFNPLKDKKPYMQNYVIDRDDVNGIMLLNALEYIKETDSTLAFRRSCGGGVCGSDGMNINGKNGLSCITPLDSLSDTINIYPLPGFPVIRDLIVDMNQFYAQYERGEPYLQHDGEKPNKEFLQSPQQREKLDGLYECILCGCCSSACPSYWWNPDKFMGPAALLNTNRFLQDSRDNASEKRLKKMKDAYSVYRCRGIMNCASVCPKGLNPTKAITDIKKKIIQNKSES